jgi:predicted O-linked N-acetylglucosamine transferase (SPINDLY family)
LVTFSLRQQVLAAFSRPAKVDSGTFSSWLTTLKTANDAVLLLIDFNSEGVRAMRAAAAAEGVRFDQIMAVPAMAEGLCC